ncbi:MAG: VapC toxin family PIN domain ribonuclease [Candidatus Eiseniibacteriota bacterium]
MRAVDTGVLLCAINRFAPEHARAAAAIETLASSDQPWALPVTVLHEFLRLATHPHLAARPSSPELALGFIDQLLASPSCRLIGPGPGHRAALGEALELLGPVRGLPSGFDTAVLCREHDVREVLSADPGMRRFPFLSVRDPLHGAPWAADERPARRYRKLSRRADASSTRTPRSPG